MTPKQWATKTKATMAFRLSLPPRCDYFIRLHLFLLVVFLVLLLVPKGTAETWRPRPLLLSSTTTTSLEPPSCGTFTAAATNPASAVVATAIRGGFGGFEHFIDHDLGVDMGTTLIAVQYRDGVVVGADSRTSAGNYVSNRMARKITPVVVMSSVDNDDNDDVVGGSGGANAAAASTCQVVIARSGSAADTQYLARVARQQMERRTQWPWNGIGITPPSPTVSQVANFIRHVVRQQQQENDGSSDEMLRASLIIAGWEEDGGGRQGWHRDHDDDESGCSSGEGYIYTLLPGGTLRKETAGFAVSGSGSTILLSELDGLVSSNSLSTMTQSEAMALCSRLLRRSMDRDAASGGIVRLTVMNRQGMKHHTMYPGQEQPQGIGSDGEDTGTISSSLTGNVPKLNGFADAMTPTTSAMRQ